MDSSSSLRKTWLQAAPYSVSFVLHAAVVFAMLYHAPIASVSTEGLTLELMNTTIGKPAKPLPFERQKTRSRGDLAVKAKTEGTLEETAASVTPVASSDNHASAEAQAKFGQAAVAPSALSQYVAVLVEALQKNRSYPRDAINREEEGVVALAVKLGSAGDVIEARVKNPSPFESLNAAALKTVQKIGQFPKPPIAEGTSIELTIPLRFKIERL